MQKYRMVFRKCRKTCVQIHLPLKRTFLSSCHLLYKTTKPNNLVMEKRMHLPSDCSFYCNQLSPSNAYGEKKVHCNSLEYAFNMDELASFITL